MPVIRYKEIDFREASENLIYEVNQIIEEYESQGFDLTLRQVYYQLVSRAMIENTERSYKNIGNLINNARLAGYIDWNSITDRTRNLRENSHWSHPASILRSALNSYRLDKWDGQKTYVEVWIEKDALVGVISDICCRLDVPYFSCRGYTSQSEMWAAAQRMINKIDDDETNFEECIVLHLGDHDPSGIDMTRDIQERLDLFGANVFVNRIALTEEQVNAYGPPPNPAKLTDTRASDYIKNFGYKSWELDALEPKVITELIHYNVSQYQDFGPYDEIVEREDQ